MLYLVPGSGSGNESVAAAQPSLLLRRYPLWRVLCLNGLTVAHYVIGCVAVLVAYRSYPLLGWPIGLAYLVFALVQLYLLMPLVVCPGCVYRTVHGGRCARGLNVVSARLCSSSTGLTGFRERSHGAFCQSNMCLWAWALPVPLALPGVCVSFSWQALTLTTAVSVLTILWLTVTVRRVVCLHCLARRWCPLTRERQAA
jgi:hypothetical protein